MGFTSAINHVLITVFSKSQLRIPNHFIYSLLNEWMQMADSQLKVVFGLSTAWGSGPLSSSLFKGQCVQSRWSQHHLAPSRPCPWAWPGLWPQQAEAHSEDKGGWKEPGCSSQVNSSRELSMASSHEKEKLSEPILNEMRINRWLTKI